MMSEYLLFSLCEGTVVEGSARVFNGVSSTHNAFISHRFAKTGYGLLFLKC